MREEGEEGREKLCLPPHHHPFHTSLLSPHTHTRRHDALEKFGVASVQAASLRSSLRPLADAYAVHPSPAGASPADAATLPALVSSRGHPDADAACAAASEAALAAATGGGGGRGGGAKSYVALGAAADAVNAVVDHLMMAPAPGESEEEDGRGVLAPGSRARRALAAAAHAAAAPGAGPPPGGGKAAPSDARAALVTAALAGRLPAE